jgi:hypothetical protein
MGCKKLFTSRAHYISEWSISDSVFVVACLRNQYIVSTTHRRTFTWSFQATRETLNSRGVLSSVPTAYRDAVPREFVHRGTVLISKCGVSVVNIENPCGVEMFCPSRVTMPSMAD